MNIKLQSCVVPYIKCYIYDVVVTCYIVSQQSVQNRCTILECIIINSKCSVSCSQKSVLDVQIKVLSSKATQKHYMLRLVGPHCTSHAPQCLFYMLRLSTHTVLHVRSVLHMLIFCLFQPCSTYTKPTCITPTYTTYIVSLLSVCSRPCALLSVVCYITKTKESSLVQVFCMRTVKRCYSRQALFQQLPSRQHQSL